MSVVGAKFEERVRSGESCECVCAGVDLHRCVLAAGPLLFAATALAQDETAGDPARSEDQETARPSEVEEIVVTGTTEGVSDMDTSSVTAFDSETLAALGVQDIADISDYTPNLEIRTHTHVTAIRMENGRAVFTNRGTDGAEQILIAG